MYRRYVDDTLLLVKGDSKDIADILNCFNSLHQKISFTAEHEQNKSINYLDLNITRHNNTCTIKVYRKNTMTNTTIHATSCHPNIHKQAAYRSMLHRATKLPLKKENLEQEINIVKQIAVANDYTASMVDTVLERVRRDPDTNHTTEGKDKNKCISSIPYVGHISQKIANIFKNHKVKIGFSTANKLQQKLIHDIKCNHDPYSDSGIYKITCQECSMFYLGQTGRDFNTRYTEHIKAYTHNRHTTSAIATHIHNTGHPFGKIEQNVKVLHRLNKSHQMDLLEELEIYSHYKKYEDKILNEKLESESVHFFRCFDNIL